MQTMDASLAGPRPRRAEITREIALSRAGNPAELHTAARLRRRSDAPLPRPSLAVAR